MVKCGSVLWLSVLPALTLAIFNPLAVFGKPPAKTPPAKVLPWTKPGWKLTFHDEFSGTMLDRRHWLDAGAHGERTHGDEEQEYYAADGYTVGGGILRLKAERRSEGGKPYTSGMVDSYSHFAQVYGWFEIRAKFPAGKGMWPAFWLLPQTGAWPPEIDVLELLGHQPNVVYMTNHWVTGTHQQHGARWTGPDFTQGFHTFAIDWEPGLIVWYVDGVERARSTSVVPAEPMYLIANLAVGGSWPGNPDATTPFPGFMDIDYIRVYQKNAP